jgi:hypothetical protein
MSKDFIELNEHMQQGIGKTIGKPIIIGCAMIKKIEKATHPATGSWVHFVTDPQHVHVVEDYADIKKSLGL